jgi:imidazolonepropionase-like amidohydrolase
MKTIQKHDGSVTTLHLIQWATLNGARFFEWERDLGSIETGKAPGLNLISEINSESFQLSSTSKVTRLS